MKILKFKKIIGDVFSRPLFQPLFEKVLNLSMKILNIGEGQIVETSGEETVLKVLDKISGSKEVTVFDVGAHVGEWVNLFKAHFHKKASVYSFEPSKKAYSELSKINMEGLYTENLALGEVKGRKYLSANITGESTACVSDKKNNMKLYEQIDIVTLDEYCAENKIDTIDLLKLDVEGYELKVLEGAGEMINKGKIKLIQFEFGATSSEKYSLKQFFDILSKQYQICRILKHGYYPLKRYNHYYEIMTVTNFVAIRKDIFTFL